MNRFDKLKLLITSRNLIKEIDLRDYDTHTKGGHTIRQSLKKSTPYHLYVEINHEKNSVILEFTSKILTVDAYKLISSETIHQCLDKIKQIAKIDFDNEEILNQADVCACHITLDTEIDCPLKELQESIRKETNYAKWEVDARNNGNIIVESKAKTGRYRLRMTIYNKHRELMLAKNKEFRNLIGKEGMEHYKNTVRIELTANSKHLIRKLLNIPHTTLATVLQSKEDTVYDTYRKIFAKIPDRPLNIKPYKYFQIRSILERYNNDLSVIERHIRIATGRTPRTQIMNEYRLVRATLYAERSRSVAVAHCGRPK